MNQEKIRSVETSSDARKLSGGNGEFRHPALAMHDHPGRKASDDDQQGGERAA
jgi:hypothetical protein